MSSEYNLEDRLISLRNIAKILKPMQGVTEVKSKADTMHMGDYDIQFKFNTGRKNLSLLMTYSNEGAKLYLRPDKESFMPEDSAFVDVAEIVYHELRSSLPCENGSPIGMIDMGGFYLYTNVKVKTVLDYDRTTLERQGL